MESEKIEISVSNLMKLISNNDSNELGYRLMELVEGKVTPEDVKKLIMAGNEAIDLDNITEDDEEEIENILENFEYKTGVTLTI